MRYKQVCQKCGKLFSEMEMSPPFATGGRSGRLLERDSKVCPACGGEVRLVKDDDSRSYQRKLTGRGCFWPLALVFTIVAAINGGVLYLLGIEITFETLFPIAFIGFAIIIIVGVAIVTRLLLR